MKFFDIVTLTVNPALDKSTKFSGLVAEQKIRCDMPHYDAGGGGINASKAIARLGGESLCIFTSGGSAGKMVEKLVAEAQIATEVIPTENWTRESLVTVDTQTNKQYRFGFPGAELSTDEKQKILLAITTTKPKFLIASGSLNDNLETDFYAKIAEICQQSGTKLILDTSGEALKKALKVGVYLVKPNIGELAKLIGVEKLNISDVKTAAKKLIENQQAKVVVVSLGSKGAILTTKDESHHIIAPEIEKKSTVGAGDSMVGGMTWALSQNKSMEDVIKWGVACGTAATMNDGTQLFKLEDAKKLFNDMSKK